MSWRLLEGLLAALGAALLYGAAPVAQTVAAQRLKPSWPGVIPTSRLSRQPIWLLGLSCELGGFLLEALAFSIVPATLVAPIMACDMLVFVVLSWPYLHRRPTGRGFLGVGIMTAGVGLLAIAFSARAVLGSPATTPQLISLTAAMLALVVLGYAIGTPALRAGHRGRAAAIFSTASGVAYSVATIATRQIGRTFTWHQPIQLLASPAPYVLAGCSVLAVTLMQRGLQTNPILAFPITSAGSAFLPLVAEVTVLGDQVPTQGHAAAFAVALSLLAIGVTLLGLDRSAAQPVPSTGSRDLPAQRRP